MSSPIARLIAPLFAHLAQTTRQPRPHAARALRMLRRLAPALGDPALSFELAGMCLRVPLSHTLPSIRARLPGYAAQIGRFARLLEEREPAAVVIDIGANVGDTVAIVREHSALAMLCIEASPMYFSLLQQNVGALPHVTLLQRIVGGEGAAAHRLVHGEGSAWMQRDERGVKTVTLAEVMAEQPQLAQRVRLLKIDTDGMDGLILRGSQHWLRAVRPVLFFEYDPNLWQQQADDARACFDFLRAVGYRSFVFYDNQGDLLGVAAGEDSERLDDFHYWVADAAHQRYFDIFAFTAEDAPLARAFLAEERARLRRRDGTATTQAAPARRDDHSRSA